MTNLMDNYKALKVLIEEAYDDVKKAEDGNKAAGTRIRKTMQEIKSQAQTVRQSVLELRK